MIRFKVDELKDISLRKNNLVLQIRQFMDSDAFKELFSLLNVDSQSIKQIYDFRKTKGGHIIETQELSTLDCLQDKRDKFTPLFRELGFFDIYKPLKEKYSHIVVLGASLSASYHRSKAASCHISENTDYIDALTCYRPINPVERNKEVKIKSDTEFSAICDSFVDVFNLDPLSFEDEFYGSRNLNAISNIRKYKTDKDKNYRIYAAPSSEPDIRRADTADTLHYYLQNNEFSVENDSLLFITNNRYCNRQFLQLEYCMLTEKVPLQFDIIGCFEDIDAIIENYDPLQYIQDIIAMLDWYSKIKTIS